VAVASEGTVVDTVGASDVISLLPAASTLLGVGRLGYESHLVEIEAVPVLDLAPGMSGHKEEPLKRTTMVHLTGEICLFRSEATDVRVEDHRC